MIPDSIGLKDKRNNRMLHHIKISNFIEYMLLISILFLLIIFGSTSSLAQGNITISGASFLDVNSNGVRDDSEPGLVNYNIYIDENNNSHWDEGEPNSWTNELGNYTISVAPGNYKIKALMANEQLQPTYPSSGFQINGSSKEPLTFDFGYSTKSISAQLIIDYIKYIFIILIIVTILGLFILIKGIYDISNNKSNNNLIILAAGFALTLISIYLIYNIFLESLTLMQPSLLNDNISNSIIAPVILGLLIFGAAILMCRMHKNQHEQGSMRRMISAVLVVGLIGVIFYALGNNEVMANRDIITQYIQLVGMVIAFYFGSRVGSEVPQSAQTESISNEETGQDYAEYDENRKELKLSSKKFSESDIINKIIIKLKEDTIAEYEKANIDKEIKDNSIKAIAKLRDKNNEIKPLQFDPDKNYEIILYIEGKDNIIIHSKVKKI